VTGFIRYFQLCGRWAEIDRGPRANDAEGLRGGDHPAGAGGRPLGAWVLLRSGSGQRPLYSPPPGEIVIPGKLAGGVCEVVRGRIYPLCFHTNALWGSCQGVGEKLSGDNFLGERYDPKAKRPPNRAKFIE